MKQNFQSRIAGFIFKRRKIRFAILSVFLGLFTLSAIVTSTYTYLRIEKVMQISSREIIEKTQQTIIKDTEDYLQPGRDTPIIATWLERATNTSLLKNQSLINYLIGALKQFSHINAYFCGDELGNLLAIGRVQGRKVYSFRAETPLPNGSQFYVYRVDRRGSKTIESREYLDIEGNLLDVEILPDSKTKYDPRKRPWYTIAKETRRSSWTNVYLYATGKLGITSSAPVFDKRGNLQHVVSADITVRKISELLAKQKASRSGISFIFNKEGDLVGYPDPDKIILEVNNTPTIGKIAELGEDTLTMAYEKYQKTKTPHFFFLHDNIEYIAHFTPYPKKFGKDWVLGMVVPADDFIGPIKETNRDVLIISLLILAFATVLLIIFSHKISYPIEKLAKDMKKIQNLEIESSGVVKTRLQEIYQMNDALILMKEGLAAFGKFVPKALVKSLIQANQEATLGGDRKKLVIMFTDIANFTSTSETMDSDELMHHLTDYFTHLSRIIITHKGTIDKFIGDAIMSFWGAPEEDGNKIVNACQAALLCKKHLDQFNAEWAEQGKPIFVTRFGLHYGEVIVGNVGSADRMNYTVIGDSVNLAARLESANKMYHTNIIVSETIHDEVKDKFLTRALDRVAVKGKKQGVDIYELVAKPGDDTELVPTDAEMDLCQRTNEAFEVYLKQDWEQCIKLFEGIQQDHPEDYIASLYIKRCKDYKENPPSKDWDGVFVMKVK